MKASRIVAAKLIMMKITDICTQKEERREVKYVRLLQCGTPVASVQ